LKLSACWFYKNAASALIEAREWRFQSREEPRAKGPKPEDEKATLIQGQGQVLLARQALPEGQAEELTRVQLLGSPARLERQRVGGEQIALEGQSIEIEGASRGVQIQGPLRVRLEEPASSRRGAHRADLRGDRLSLTLAEDPLARRPKKSKSKGSEDIELSLLSLEGRPAELDEQRDEQSRSVRARSVSWRREAFVLELRESVDVTQKSGSLAAERELQITADGARLQFKEDIFARSGLDKSREERGGDSKSKAGFESLSRLQLEGRPLRLRLLERPSGGARSREFEAWSLSYEDESRELRAADALCLRETDKDSVTELSAGSCELVLVDGLALMGGKKSASGAAWVRSGRIQAARDQDLKLRRRELARVPVVTELRAAELLWSEGVAEIRPAAGRRLELSRVPFRQLDVASWTRVEVESDRALWRDAEKILELRSHPGALLRFQERGEDGRLEGEAFAETMDLAWASAPRLQELKRGAGPWIELEFSGRVQLQGRMKLAAVRPKERPGAKKPELELAPGVKKAEGKPAQIWKVGAWCERARLGFRKGRDAAEEAWVLMQLELSPKIEELVRLTGRLENPDAGARDPKDPGPKKIDAKKRDLPADFSADAASLILRRRGERMDWTLRGRAGQRPRLTMTRGDSLTAETIHASLRDPARSLEGRPLAAAPRRGRSRVRSAACAQGRRR
jgi:hypothetical protein